jgi:hypothetical protein
MEDLDTQWVARFEEAKDVKPRYSLVEFLQVISRAGTCHSGTFYKDFIHIVDHSTSLFIVSFAFLAGPSVLLVFSASQYSHCIFILL